MIAHQSAVYCVRVYDAKITVSLAGSSDAFQGQAVPSCGREVCRQTQACAGDITANTASYWQINAPLSCSAALAQCVQRSRASLSCAPISAANSTDYRLGKPIQ
jgi:hypothetical protein